MGHWGYPGSQTLFFFKHGHVAYQIDGDDEQNKMQVTFSSLGQTGDLGAKSKGQISLKCQFQRFSYQTLFVFSQIKDRKNIEQNLHSVAKVMPRVGLRGAGGVKNFSVGICDGAPSTAHSCLFFLVDKGREDPNTTISRSTSARQQTPFKWHLAGGPMVAQH